MKGNCIPVFDTRKHPRGNDSDWLKRWSYARTIVPEHDGDPDVEVAEKDPISNWATLGLYGWRYGSDLIGSIRTIMFMNETVNGEFYMAPTYNYALKHTDLMEVPYEAFLDLGTPEALEANRAEALSRYGTRPVMGVPDEENPVASELPKA